MYTLCVPAVFVIFTNVSVKVQHRVSLVVACRLCYLGLLPTIVKRMKVQLCIVFSCCLYIFVVDVCSQWLC